MADTLARMSADTLECDEARVQFNTHLEQLASCIRKRSHLVNVAAHQVEAADRPPRARPLQPRPPAGSKRERLFLETTHTLTETDSQFHCESCHATVLRERLNSWLQRGPCLATLDAHAPIFIGRVALHGSHTLTFLDDRRTWTCTACGHVARLRALKLGQPCSRVTAKWTDDTCTSLTRYRPAQPSTRRAGGPVASRHAAVSSSEHVAGEENMWLPLFELDYHNRMGAILLPLRGQNAVRQFSASCHFGLMQAPIAHESVMKASAIPLDGTSVD